MASQKLVQTLEIVTNEFREKQIPYSLIGALALGLYGAPRFTADIDILSEHSYCDLISSVMENLGYTCYQKTKLFAQFDSEKGTFGRIDFIFVRTPEGKDIIKHSAMVDDEILSNHPVIQPVDYIGLKLMAIANNPTRSLKDDSDILQLLQVAEKGLLPPEFESPDRDRIYYYADRFGQRVRIDSIFHKLAEEDEPSEDFEI